MNELITEIRGKPVATSRKVAETFGKEHYYVISNIENLDCSEKFTAFNFEVSTYKDKSGKKMQDDKVLSQGTKFHPFGCVYYALPKIKQRWRKFRPFGCRFNQLQK